MYDVNTQKGEISDFLSFILTSIVYSTMSASVVTEYISDHNKTNKSDN